MSARLACFLLTALGASACLRQAPPVLLGDAGVIDPGPGPQPPGACNAFEFRGVEYNCDAVDRCTLTDLSTALACCECNPIFCDPAPDCSPFVGEPADSCMECHNGSERNDYAGAGLSNPHPFGPPLPIPCTQCHGGDGTQSLKDAAHVPPPPEIGDRFNQSVNPEAWFNKLTFAGVDKYPDYSVDGVTYTAAQFIQFINPGDLRVVQLGRGCGECHFDHALSMANASPIGTEIGFFSAATFHIGVENAVPENRGRYNDSAADYTFRGGVNEGFVEDEAETGEVGRTIAVPEHAGFGGAFDGNSALNADALDDDQLESGQVQTGSDLAKLFQTQVSITCGDCHAGSNGANNRYADFRSSGCTVCHMEYSLDGRSRSTDPNVPKLEPADPDAIAAPERSHVFSHQIRNVAKIIENGAFVRGISDRACVGCHQGSNRTVLQYWGIRLDQNADLANAAQYPTNPVTFVNTAADTRLFDPAVQNNTFNGRDANQYILEEDYDGDGRDDTPADVHYEAGLGCIDCHGSRDVHAGTEGDFSGKIFSKMDQVVKVRCESCHGDIESYALTTPCLDYLGQERDCLMDENGNALRNTERDVNGDCWLVSRVDGGRHYLPQVRDVVFPNNESNPLTGRLVFNAKASYAMGRADGTVENGVGPQQTNPALVQPGFSHTDNMDCTSCHASWANQCIGCHLRTQYDELNAFYSNITGERIVMKQQNADFTYITPVPTYLGVNSKNKITQISAGMKVFYAYIDLNGDTSRVFAFSDRNGNGNNPGTLGRNAHPALGHYQMAPHSIRGAVGAADEGPKYCVACHLTVAGLAEHGAAYDAFRVSYAARDYASLDFSLLQFHIGANPGNQLDSPFYVHATAGLGSAMYLFDRNGCPVNPFDTNADRFFCNGVAPASTFEATGFDSVAYDLDRFVEVGGVSNSSSLHPMLELPTLRDGALDVAMSGPLGATLLNKLTNPDVQGGGIVLDAWLDADGEPQGDAADFIQ